MDQLDISINPAEKYSYSSVRWKEPEMYVTALLFRKKKSTITTVSTLYRIFSMDIKLK